MLHKCFLLQGRLPLKYSLRKFNNNMQQRSFAGLCNKMAFLGGGQMAESILNAIHINKIQPMNQIIVFDTNKQRLAYLKEKYEVSVSDSAGKAVDGADVVLLAVKPQNVEDLAISISKDNITVSGMILSIVAGFSIAKLSDLFKTKQVMRTMPNTPAMVLEGMTVWTATDDTDESLKTTGMKLLDAIGEQLEVRDEKYLDMATAISGSGPAYVFLTMEAMIDAGVHMGFPRDTAQKLVIATLRGSASYARKSERPITSLKNGVTSPGGTTASALYELERGGFRTVVADAIWSAYRRALELGGNDPNVGPGRNKYPGH